MQNGKPRRKTSINQDIKPFAKFIAYLIDVSFKGEPVVKI